jgi:hypothetical protein
MQVKCGVLACNRVAIRDFKYDKFFYDKFFIWQILFTRLYIDYIYAICQVLYITSTVDACSCSIDDSSYRLNFDLDKKTP